MNTSPFTAMFWKECRENGRWAVLATMALSLGLIIACYRIIPSSTGQNTPLDFTRFWSSENLVLTITTPLIALALGLLQILPELRRDQWAFLVHRPATRTALFVGKVISGVSLYLLATVLPLLGLTLWAAQPGHIPTPFDFRFTLAGWAAVLAGLPFYFAGLLVALRPARWYGSRPLPLAAALLAPLAAGYFSEFGQVVLVCLLATLILAGAAWGSFVSSGRYPEQTKPARFALGVSLYPGAVALGLGAVMLIFVLINASVHPGQQEGWRNEQKVDAQGNLYWSVEHFDGQGGDTTVVTDYSGKTVPPPVWKRLNDANQVLDLSYVSDGNSYGVAQYSNPRSYVFSLTGARDEASLTVWYYVVAARQIIGYTVSAGRTAVAGYVGPQGFSRNSEEAREFPAARPENSYFDESYLLRFPTAVYLYNTAGTVPTVHLVQRLPEGQGGMSFLGQDPNGDQSAPGQLLLVTTGSEITAYSTRTHGHSQSPNQLFTISSPAGLKTYSSVQVAMTADRSRFYFLFQKKGPLDAGVLLTVAEDGRVLKSQAVPNLNTGASGIKFVQAFPAVLLPPLALGGATVYGALGHLFGWPSAQGFWDMASGDEAKTSFALRFFSFVGGLLAAVFALLISRRCGDTKRQQWLWAFGVFWLGVYGVLMLLALRPWPVRLPCPHCGRLRAVDRVSCECCGREWPAPTPDGTEIRDAEVQEFVQR